MSEALNLIYEAVVKVLPPKEMPVKGKWQIKGRPCPLGCLLRWNEMPNSWYPVEDTSGLLGVSLVWVQGFISGWDSRPFLSVYKNDPDYLAGILAAQELRCRLREEGRK